MKWEVTLPLALPLAYSLSYPTNTGLSLSLKPQMSKYQPSFDLCEQACKLEATLVGNYDLLSYRLTEVRSTATSVAKKDNCI